MTSLPIPQPSNLKDHLFNANISEVTYKYRILRMKDSIFIYVGQADNEVFTEMAVAMPMTNSEVVSTRILGVDVGCESQEMAKTFAKKLNKQVFFSCNVDSDKMIRPMLAKYLSDEIKRCPEVFT
ncbi:hypothetical protein HA402_016003 [Bradysia odoriphaga]|nr:hypothetical protein HA402_016003 [Bradysia odoriphaga]